MKKLIALMMTVLMGLLLAGCVSNAEPANSSEPEAAATDPASPTGLDRELTLGNAGSVMVPANWTEATEESLVGEGATYTLANPDGEGALTVTCIDYANEVKKAVLLLSPSESMEASLDVAKEEHPGATEWNSELIDQRTISGADCEIYDVSCNEGAQGTQTVHSYEAYLTKGDVTVSIKSPDEELLFAVLDTLKLA